MKIFLSLMLVLLMSYAVGKLLKQSSAPISKENVIHSDCNPTKNRCEILTKYSNYTLELDGEVSPLVPFSVRIITEDIDTDSIDLFFEMSDMDMGFNQYSLIEHAGSWRAKVILPICSLSRNDWVLSVKVKIADVDTITKFKFSH